MPALAKAPEDKTGHHGPPRELVPGTLPAPDPPRGLPIVLRRQWVDLWCSPIGQRLLDRETDAPVVARLFELYALGERVAGLLDGDARAERAARLMLADVDDAERELRESLAEDAVLARRLFNTTVGTRVRVATECRMLESQLGLSPRSRLALGVMLMAGRKAMAQAANDDDDDDY